ncbi:hypothetical protein ACF8OI_02580 [Aeromonas bivalvium]|uniref:hypothetical protein n=1 Tax=Aeromonas bivalvium TaxID=440079 RepID=UPI003709DA30
MKTIYISIAAITLSINTVNAKAIEYQLEQDGVVDGIVAEGSSVNLNVNQQQNSFSGYDEPSVTKGYFSNNENVIIFDKTTKDTVSYYLGSKSEDGHYKGNWYDTDGNGGDFRLVSSNVENEGCLGASQTGWYNSQYCNMEIDGGGWQLVAIRLSSSEGVGAEVEKITTLDSSQYIRSEEWINLKKKMKEVLFVQPNSGVWGVMNISNSSAQDLCKPLSDDLSSPVLLHAEDSGCDGFGTDYTYIGHPEKIYQGNLYFHSKNFPLWTIDSRNNTQEYFYSDQLMVYVR